MTTLIPTSGDFLRLFSRTPMAAATWRVAATIAGHISYDGQYRGAPKGHSAWTMAELQSETGLSERSVRDALAELARLFGLIIHRRPLFGRQSQVNLKLLRAVLAHLLHRDDENRLS